MCSNEIVFPALANVIGQLLRLLHSKAHATRIGQELQEIVGSVISLLLRHGAGSSGRGRSSSLRDLAHTSIVASSKFLVHVQDSIGQFSELTLAHDSMFFPKHAFKQIALFSPSPRGAYKHLLPAMPDIVVAMFHPAHVASPMFMEAKPAAVETDSSRIAKIATMKVTTKRHGTRAVIYRLVNVPTPKAAVTPHDDAMQKIYSSDDDKWPDIECVLSGKDYPWIWVMLRIKQSRKGWKTEESWQVGAFVWTGE